MTSRYRRQDQVHEFSCDEPGCHANYEGEPAQFKEAWREASAHGWNYVPEYVNGVSEPRHYCPHHSKKFG